MTDRIKPWWEKPACDVIPPPAAMTDTAKPTAGPWEIGKPYGRLGVEIVGSDGATSVCNISNIEKNVTDREGRVIGKVDIERAVADSRLIIEAGTVYHETGLTPRQLVEQRDELLAELKLIHGWAVVEKAPLRMLEITRIEALVDKVEAKP